LFESRFRIGGRPFADVVLVRHEYGYREFFGPVRFFGEPGKPVILNLLRVIVDGAGFPADI